MATDHYVPQLLLREFATPSGGESICVWDKEDDRIFYPKIKDFGIEHFNTFARDENAPFLPDVASIEPMLGRLVEDPAAPVIARIIRNNSLKVSDEERQKLIVFAILQFLRTPGQLQAPEALANKAVDELNSQDALDAGKFAPVGNFKKVIKATGSLTKPSALRNLKIASIPIDLVNLSVVMTRVHLALITSDEDMVIGDDPVVVQRLPGQLPYVLYELSAPGSDVFLPISRRHALYLHTPLEARTGVEGKTLSKPCPITSGEVAFLNDLQVKKAVRYIVLSNEEQRPAVRAALSASEGRFVDFRRIFST